MPTVIFWLAICLVLALYVRARLKRTVAETEAFHDVFHRGRDL